MEGGDLPVVCWRWGDWWLPETGGRGGDGKGRLLEGGKYGRRVDRVMEAGGREGRYTN